MIWDGTSPLRPEHEVAYRGWPSERVEIRYVVTGWVVSTRGQHGIITHSPEGIHCISGCNFDLIPLQKEPGNE